MTKNIESSFISKITQIPWIELKKFSNKENKSIKFDIKSIGGKTCSIKWRIY